MPIHLRRAACAAVLMVGAWAAPSPVLAQAEVFEPPVRLRNHGPSLYHVLDREVVGRGVVRVMSRMNSPAMGIVFTYREFDCLNERFRVLREAPSEHEARTTRGRGADQWGGLVEGSMTWQAFRVGCALGPRR